MDIIKAKTSLAILVHHYQIPLAKLTSGKNLEIFSTLFNFQQTEGMQDANKDNIIGVQFRLGTFNANDDRDIVINKLVIEERKIVIDIEGASQYADELFKEIVSIFSEWELNKEPGFLEPIIQAYDSEIIAGLDFHISKLIAPSLLNFLDKVADSAKSELADARILPAALSFLIDYETKSRDLSDHRISLSRKEFSIQPAVGSPLDEQTYLSRAPFETQVHINLLKELESVFIT
jgi:hypothetical protein